MRSRKRYATLPIGRAAKLAFEIDALRAACSKAAGILLNAKHVDEEELEECARLDDALAESHRLLKGSVREIVLSRLQRRSQTR